ncbi:MAG: hypothetical protein RIR26_821 [Pseudomonadota bacterium]|jgi:hypothetical protein
MRILSGDIVFQRDGRPALVKTVNKEEGKVVLEQEIDQVQKSANRGIKNNLLQEQREAYNAVLEDVSNSDKHQEIRDLYGTIQKLKANKVGDSKVLRYLENELMHRMNREKYTPKEFEIDLENIPLF